MSNDLSPEQQDPEQRIKELERGLTDTNHTAPPYAAPPQLPPFPPAYQGPPSFTPLPMARRSASRAWLWMVAVVVLPLLATIAFVIPWQKLNVFGPTEVPKGGSLTVDDIDGTKTVACNDGNLTVGGIHMTVTVTGHCASLTVQGQQHHVTVDSADTINASGIDNVVTYHSGSPQISGSGIHVTVRQG